MKNKINNYDFLVIGAGLIGSLTALSLLKKKFSVLVIDKNKDIPKDTRTLAVNANSKDFLKKIGVWNKVKSEPEPIKKIVIKDYINKQPLVFDNPKEEMGNVIFNRELLIISRKILIKQKLLVEGINIEIEDILPNKKISIKGKKYLFKYIILSMGKRYQNNNKIKKFTFPSDHFSHVGFFRHSLKHKQTAFEIFTPEGPLAVLPSPDRYKKKSTFILSSNKNFSKKKINSLIEKYFNTTHGSIKLENEINKFEIIPHLSINKSKEYILIGDTLKSIHPVAGQGWNLGIKDIQILENILDHHDLNDPNLLKKYYSYRIIENTSYLTFTSFLNYIYESKNPLSNLIIKTGFKALNKFNFLRRIFIKQAMGRSKLI